MTGVNKSCDTCKEYLLKRLVVLSLVNSRAECCLKVCLLDWAAPLTLSLSIWPLLISIITVCSCFAGAFTCSTTRPVLFGGSASGEEPIQFIQLKMRLNMAPLPLLALCVLGVCALSRVEEMKSQERLFLGSLGLSERPRTTESQKPWRHVPVALWRMFRRSENIQVQESDPCIVPEYGVRGNIIRYVQDQGSVIRFSVYTVP